MKSYLDKIPLFLIILIFFSQTQVQAQINRSLIFTAPPPPKGVGEPGKRAEAGSRGCEQDINQPSTSAASEHLTALVPVYSKSDVVFATASTEHPRFWFYVPYLSSFADGEFVLEDEAQNQSIYKASLPNTPGVISFDLPSSAKPLEVGKQYHWYFNIYCKSDRQIIAYVEGDIKREQLNSTLKTKLEKASPSQRVTLYAANGIWHDALSEAEELRRKNPRDTSWEMLLQAVGLNNFVTKPTLDCCTLKQ
ncbi:DUF928 domain-containing protein [Nostoc sp. FACHB-152]|uniref:DUF928 domain-containing protein n=1 Tax=unclassified Nostoc TaxID=2593658 RepID=UPI001683F874|nr:MULTISPECIES: DUF928 domain-containing protein [unclassified Nostoc]MBD2450314.1 DUF928 domain-containing protein [Nostoc sp. FACHB-152]MBD2471782.1 DUF928 domain-containing protein [Nostoc sp. FACHB-145]